ncbi:MAG: prepilin-type N-terminal cleavage/methylation domain-containing protein [Planctomycetota bacterium]
MRGNTHRGFTLIEIIISVLIIGIVASMAITAVNANSSTQAEAAAKSLAAQLSFARDRAVGRGQWHYVVVHGDFRTVAVNTMNLGSFVPVTEPYSSEVLELSLRRDGTADFDGVTLSEVDIGGRFVLAFDENGTPHSASNSGTSPVELRSESAFRLSSSGATFRVTVSPIIGDVTIE